MTNHLKSLQNLIESFERLPGIGHKTAERLPGLPCVADPGCTFVALCQREGFEVIPLSGPSSLMMALMASGFNGQSFAFVGYLPAEEAGKIIAIPGTSEHQLGLAVDLIDSSYPYLDEGQEKTPAQKWLMEHC